EDWSRQIGAELKDGLREVPSWIAFARGNGTVYHTYTVAAPDPFVAPYYSFLLDRTPKGPPEEPRAWRKDEYPEGAWPPAKMIATIVPAPRTRPAPVIASATFAGKTLHSPRASARSTS